MDMFFENLLLFIIGLIVLVIIASLCIFLMAPGLEKYLRSYLIREIDDNEFIFMEKEKAYSFFKREFDIIVGFISFVIMAPLMMICVILIRMDEPGPLFVKWKTSGYKGEIVDIYTFRTMGFSCPSEDRITKSGRLLRRTGLMYLPMIYNVLKGDLSVIGLKRRRPDGLSPQERELYEFEKPGIINLGYVDWESAKRDMALKYDQLYIKKRCFKLDVALLLYTYLLPLRAE